MPSSVPSSRPRLTGGAVAWRVLAIVASAIVTWSAAFVAAFATIVIWTGCFMDCQGSNHVGGFLLGLLTLDLVAVPVALGIALFRQTRNTHRAALIVCGLPALLLVGSIGYHMLGLL